MKPRSTQTKIPDGWQLLPVSDVFAFVKSYAFSRDNLVNGTVNDEGIGNIHYGDIHSTFTSPSIDLSQVSISTIKDRSFVPKQENMLKDGDLIMADASEDYAGVGVTVSVHGLRDRKVVGGLHTFVLRDMGGKTDEYYRQYIFRNPAIRNALQKIANGVSVYGISKTALSKILLPLPPLPEQRRIVSILETWDKAIDEVTNEIYLKEQIKEVVTQKMLFGKNDKSAQFQKNRYLTVPSRWKIVNIGEVAKSISRKNSQNNSLPVLSCTVHRGLVDSLSFFKKQIFSKNLSTYKIVKRNQFVYATNHIEEGSIGLQDIYDEGLVSPMYTVFECDERILPEYLYPLLKTELFRHVFESSTSSSVNRRGSLRWSVFSKIKIPLPSLAEQRKIIEIISATRKEIVLLEKKFDNLRSQKAYLLNALMTGAIRTPENLSI